ncbi:Serine/threonine-protein phosphatase 2A 56 kDa regulatory subunit delta 2 isoform [Schizosaccharomyces pombe]|uniref:Serine/threonine-protein phosphatase 2A 56 kDa regulatory subunit delta 2 isoform n=1 Tax=Schizosaccharomyces pombe (strain 972 / ATCC 24843) TaxID=284812 RepID=2AD2_SCHPO|nr:protein phosphatase regulatory subunit Par2 [Schizosaccharomyces pombe]P78759.2 RecName: Full=Serine/threonine-protein phosphatase 2A 56 kDa regulatory subunit delta 2 isoform; AltName: Full=PP2A, B subunit, B' delta 2 isoform [Schizosaccharomyces pombe 972h-]BAB40598.1 Pbp2 [Schizosaccharomyces pombe]CAB11096.1 protein phosphatase regulatory subunit Par2 [Schizosaccharomyces pombe]|eukprot:NP_593298.1 protein phosphatase regulatory subunit Par2 [Schizosaccharomyces pombe]
MKGLRSKFVKALSLKDEQGSHKNGHSKSHYISKNGSYVETDDVKHTDTHHSSKHELKKLKSHFLKDTLKHKRNHHANSNNEKHENSDKKIHTTVLASGHEDSDYSTFLPVIETSKVKDANHFPPNYPEPKNDSVSSNIDEFPNDSISSASFLSVPQSTPPYLVSQPTPLNKFLAGAENVDIPHSLRPVPRREHSSQFQVSEKRTLVRLPSFDDVHTSEREELFIKKLEQCNIIFDFNDPSSDLASKEIKREALLQMIDYVSENRGISSASLFPYVVNTFSLNVFRPISPALNDYSSDMFALDDEPFLEPAWPHLEEVYLLFIKFLESPDFRASKAKSLVDRRFFNRLLALFDTEDPRERELLKTTLHRIYGKFLNLRSYIRKSMNNVFLQFIYEREKFHGIAELLEILGSIINGFAVPLKEEHKIFLSKVLIPLHQTKSVFLYHPQLTYCIVQFIDKDPSLTKAVLTGILKYWPRINSFKELLFLNEIEDIFEVLEPSEFVNIMSPLFQQLARSISSMHFQVAERALCLWSNEYFTSLVSQNVVTLLPIIYPSLYKTANEHWNSTIQAIACNVLQIFVDMDADFFNGLVEDYKQAIIKQEEVMIIRKQQWCQIEALAAENKPTDYLR